MRSSNRLHFLSREGERGEDCSSAASQSFNRKEERGLLDVLDRASLSLASSRGHDGMGSFEADKCPGRCGLINALPVGRTHGRRRAANPLPSSPTTPRESRLLFVPSKTQNAFGISFPSTVFLPSFPRSLRLLCSKIPPAELAKRGHMHALRSAICAPRLRIEMQPRPLLLDRLPFWPLNFASTLGLECARALAHWLWSKRNV